MGWRLNCIRFAVTAFQSYFAEFVGSKFYNKKIKPKKKQKMLVH